MNLELTPCWELAAALRLLHDGANNGDFEVGNLATRHGAHVRLKDLLTRRLVCVDFSGAKGARGGIKEKRSYVNVRL